MSTVEEIKEAIRNLPPKPRKEVTSWCCEFEEDEWDQQIEQDIKAGKLQQLADAAKKAHTEGRTTQL